MNGASKANKNSKQKENDKKKKVQEKKKNENDRDSDATKEEAIEKDPKKKPSGAENQIEKKPKIASYVNGTKNEIELSKEKTKVKEAAQSEHIDIKSLTITSENEEAANVSQRKKIGEDGGPKAKSKMNKRKKDKRKKKKKSNENKKIKSVENRF